MSAQPGKITPEEAAEHYRAWEEGRRAKERAAKVEAVKRALAAAGWAALKADPLTPEALVDALENEEWERGCRCYPAEVDS